MIEACVEFYDADSAAVSLAWDRHTESWSPEVKAQTEALLLGCYLIRQLRNLGNHPGSAALEAAVAAWLPPSASQDLQGQVIPPEGFVACSAHVLYRAALGMGMDHQTAMSSYGKPVTLVAFRGQGGKRFIGRLSEGRRGPTFILTYKGFGLGGLLGAGLPQYGTDSVLLLMTALAAAHSSDEGFAHRLHRAAICCADSMHRVTMTNQEAVALACVKPEFE